MSAEFTPENLLQWAEEDLGVKGNAGAKGFTGPAVAEVKAILSSLKSPNQGRGSRGR